MTVLTEQTETLAIRTSTFHGYDIVRWLVGAILLTAAEMKGYELATGPVAEKGLLTSRWFLIAAIEFELALGLFLVSGLWKRLTWWVAVGCFAMFLCVTAYKAWLGNASCGCFGRAQVDPRYALVLDVAILAMLGYWRPVGQSTWHGVRSRNRAVMVGMFLAIIGLPAGWAMATVQSSSLDQEGELIGSGSFVVLEPEKWVGKRFPLLKHIDIGDQLKTGKWIVVLYDQSCSHCQELLPKYRQWALPFSDQAGMPRFAFVEMPPYARLNRLVPPGSNYAVGKLSDTREWFIQTPAVNAIEGGQVRKILDSEQLSVASVRSNRKEVYGSY